jgi:hypothetical protein
MSRPPPPPLYNSSSNYGQNPRAHQLVQHPSSLYHQPYNPNPYPYNHNPYNNPQQYSYEQHQHANQNYNHDPLAAAAAMMAYGSYGAPPYNSQPSLSINTLPTQPLPFMDYAPKQQRHQQKKQPAKPLADMRSKNNNTAAQNSRAPTPTSTAFAHMLGAADVIATTTSHIDTHEKENNKHSVNAKAKRKLLALQENATKPPIRSATTTRTTAKSVKAPLSNIALNTNNNSNPTSLVSKIQSNDDLRRRIVLVMALQNNPINEASAFDTSFIVKDDFNPSMTAAIAPSTTTKPTKKTHPDDCWCRLNVAPVKKLPSNNEYADIAPSHIVITDGFYWRHYPACERVLYHHMSAYYAVARTKKQSRLQQDFNNSLVQIIRTHGFFEMSDKQLRDRVRCFYKTHLQNAKKRLATLLKQGVASEHQLYCYARDAAQYKTAKKVKGNGTVVAHKTTATATTNPKPAPAAAVQSTTMDDNKVAATAAVVKAPGQYPFHAPLQHVQPISFHSSIPTEPLCRPSKRACLPASHGAAT